TNEDEDRTLALVRRDLNFMQRVSEEYDGKVLKSTGDGLLISFNSAVQAVRAGMKFQASINELAKKLPPDKVLEHRIGIHLGDVFLGEDDVFGDGVNIAARLQTQAEPGGICVSQTVYDVVKNRLSLKATYLGPRELKNIREAVPVYQILLAAQGADAAGVETDTPDGVSTGPPGWVWLAAGGGVAVILGLILIVFIQDPPPPTGPIAQPPPVQPEPDPPDPGPDATEPQPPGPPPGDDRDRRVTESDLRAVQDRYLPVYDFDSLVRWMGERLPESAIYDYYQERERTYRFLREFFDQFERELTFYHRDRPLVIPPTRDDPGGRIYSDQPGRIVIMAPGSRPQSGELEDLEPWDVARIMVAMMADRFDGPRQIPGDLRDGLQAFLRTYHLEDRMRQLIRERRPPRRR
ncbi:MAG: adenylate/guanylate cyclase domain-containing protein, partial [Phycisphaeraceae bacterium]|nr:adenylate/guanylate cyclase domain-containing protein [Phycisphaeraceae bacterium]